jgi:hypothetical protein
MVRSVPLFGCEGIQVEFLPHSIPEICQDVSLCLSGNAEAARNIAKHAHTKQAHVALELAGSSLQLTICEDRGMASIPPSGGNPGLASMKERSLLRSLSIQSEPGRAPPLPRLFPCPKKRDSGRLPACDGS